VPEDPETLDPETEEKAIFQRAGKFGTSGGSVGLKTLHRRAPNCLILDDARQLRRNTSLLCAMCCVLQ